MKYEDMTSLKALILTRASCAGGVWGLTTSPPFCCAAGGGQVSVRTSVYRMAVVRSRREDPILREVRETVDANVTKTLNKQIAPALMKREIVDAFMDTLQAYGDEVRYQENPNGRAFGAMPLFRRQQVMRTDAREMRDSMGGMALKLVGVGCLLVVFLVILGGFGAVFIGLRRYLGA